MRAKLVDHTLRLVLPLAIGAAAALTPAVARAESAGPCVTVGRAVTVGADEVRRCDLVSVLGDVSIDEGGTVAGSVVVLGGDLVVAPRGAVDGDVVVTGGRAEIAGDIQGNVFATGTITLASAAVVDGDVQSASHVEQSEGATVTGDVRESLNAGEAEAEAGDRWASRIVSGAALILFGMLFSVLAVALAPGPTLRVRDALRRSPGATLFAGLVAAFLLPVLFLALLVTIVGPAILAVIAVVAVALGSVGIAEALGRRLRRSGSRLVQVLVGSALVCSALAVGQAVSGTVACATAFVSAIIGAWALGASVLTLLGTRPWPRHAVAPLAPPPGLPEDVAPPPVPLPPSGPDAGAPGPSSGAPEPEPALPDPTVAAPEPEAAPPAAEESGKPSEVSVPQGEVSAMADSDVIGFDSPPSAATSPSEPESPVPAAIRPVTDIAGIPPIYAHLLREAGFDSVAAIAGAEPEQLAAALSVQGVRGISLDTAAQWVARARDLDAPAVGSAASS